MSTEPTTIAELQRLAEAKMDPGQRDFVGRGSGGNWTRDRNRSKLDEIALNPHMLVPVDGRDLSTTVLGEKISFPVMCAPAGGQCGSHPEGERATARAAGDASTVMVLPVGSGYSIEEVADAATGPLWFQHIHYSDGITEELLPRLKPAGYTAVILTVDSLGPFPLDGDASRGVPHLTKMYGSLNERPDLLDDKGRARWQPPNITWDRLDWIRSLSGDLPLLVKGIRNVGDAARCVEYGVNGIVVSNHGGRQVDGSLSGVEVLPGIADAVGDSLEVYYDSGIRTGLDVFRAMALGARAVFVGRVLHWGLAYDGEAGVLMSLNILRGEFDRVLAFSGCTNVEQINRGHVVTAGSTIT